MTDPPPRPHLVVVQLDAGYTVSMGSTILACETLERVLASVHALLLPHIGDADDTAQAAADYFVPRIAPSPPPPPLPPPPDPSPDDDPTLPPFDPRIDTMPMDLRDEEDDDRTGPAFRDSGNPLLADEQANLAIAVAAFLRGTIDLDELRAARARYYPSATDADLEAAVALAQGLDPARFGNGAGL